LPAIVSQDVRRAAGGRDRDQHVAGAAETEDLPLEYPVVTVVVGDRSQDRAVGGRGDRGARRAVVIEPRQDLAGNVLRVARAAAVARQKKLAPAAQSLADALGDVSKGRAKSRVENFRRAPVFMLGSTRRGRGANT
jgi:hypothetical protein